MSGTPHLLFQKSGVNELGAITGYLMYFEDNRQVDHRFVFSGGLETVDEKKKVLHPPIGNGSYTIRLDIVSTLTVGQMTLDDDLESWTLLPIDGVQIIPAQCWPNAKGDAQWEWGSMRFKLNQPPHEHRKEHSGNYLHGKKREGDWTHGCICDRSEAISTRLWQLDKRRFNHIKVEVKG